MAHEREGLIRSLIIVGVGVAAEIGLRLIAWRAPALATLMRPIYIAVPILAALAVWHGNRRRLRHDRRHADRRHDGPPL